MQSAERGCSRCHDDVNFEAHQLLGESRKALVVPVGESCLNDEIRALYITELAHAPSERIVAARIQR